MNSTPDRGTTLIELIVALAVIAALALIALPSGAGLRDRSAVRSATTELAGALALARSAALAESRIVAMHIDSAAASAVVVAPPDTLLDLPLGTRYGVTVASTRDSIAYGPTGRGYGGSNATITVSRGRAADTLTVSRLGRVRS
jgi:prepilin-type N-terminal cleavage/methylation domain-containing protein